MSVKKITELSFEQALARLSEVVEKLESEDISLDESISLYEEGMKLSKFCSVSLEDAELKIEQVHKENQNTK